jgi:hypothetical protein
MPPRWRCSRKRASDREPGAAVRPEAETTKASAEGVEALKKEARAPVALTAEIPEGTSGPEALAMAPPEGTDASAEPAPLGRRLLMEAMPDRTLPSVSYP